VDSNMFNTADTNYMEIDPKGDMGVAANKGITDVVAKNNRQYNLNAQTAVALANQKSQNFMKLGQLVGQIGEFAGKVRAYNEDKDKLNAIKKSAEKSQEAIKNQNQKLQDISIEQNKDLFNPSNETNVNFKKANDLALSDPATKALAVESNAAYTEGMQLAFKADEDFRVTNSLDAGLEGIALYQTLGVPDFETKGAATVDALGKNYQGYLSANQDFKVPTEYGMISLMDAKASGQIGQLDAVKAFHEGAFYHTAGVFGGKNKLSNANILKLLKSTQNTDKIERTQFVNETFAQAKKDYETKRQSDFASAAKVDPKAALFGTDGDPLSGSIAKLQKLTGSKDTTKALETIYADIAVLTEKRELTSTDLAAISNINGISARDGSGNKTLQELFPGFHAKIEGLAGRQLRVETQEKEAKNIAKVNEVVDAAIATLDQTDAGATEVHLKAEIQNAKNLLNDAGVDVSKDGNYYRYFNRLNNYHTKDDQVDDATIPMIDHAILNKEFPTAKALIKTLNDPKVAEEKTKELKGYDVFEKNKETYKAGKKTLTDYIDTNTGITNTTATGNIKNSVISANAVEHYDEQILELVKKGVPFKSAQQQAFNFIKDRLDGEAVGAGKNERGGGVKTKAGVNLNFGEYYLKGGKGAYEGSREYNTSLAAYKASKALKDPNTKNDWLSNPNIHEYEPVHELLEYTNGGKIPMYYIEASKDLRFTTAHDLMNKRLEALGYNEEKGRLRADVMNDMPNSLVKKLLTYMPSATKTGRGMYEMDPNERNSFFENYLVKTKNAQFGNVSATNKSKLNFENIPINHTLTQSIKYGYGFNGFGRYKILPSDIRKLEQISGLDFNVDTLNETNQKILMTAQAMHNSGLNNYFSTGRIDMGSLNELDMLDIYDDKDVHNQPFMSTPELIDEFWFTDYGGMIDYGE